MSVFCYGSSTSLATPSLSWCHSTPRITPDDVSTYEMSPLPNKYPLCARQLWLLMDYSGQFVWQTITCSLIPSGGLATLRLAVLYLIFIRTMKRSIIREETHFTSSRFNNYNQCFNFNQATCSTLVFISLIRVAFSQGISEKVRFAIWIGFKV